MNRLSLALGSPVQLLTLSLPAVASSIVTTLVVPIVVVVAAPVALASGVRLVNW